MFSGLCFDPTDFLADAVRSAFRDRRVNLTQAFRA